MISTPTLIVAYLVLFAGVGFLFIFASLLLGRFLRPKSPSAEKLATYECGEPAVGSSYVQFDLRFYVVALLFIIFDVEVAFFFPWATVFGKATQLSDPRLEKVVVVAGPGDGASLEGAPVGRAPVGGAPVGGASVRLSPHAAGKLVELGVRRPVLPDPPPGDRRDASAWAEENVQRIESMANRLALTAMADIGVFFAVLLVGFAYVWSQGDLNWVRAFAGRAPPDASHPAEPAAGAAGGRNLAAGENGS